MKATNKPAKPTAIADAIEDIDQKLIADVKDFRAVETAIMQEVDRHSAKLQELFDRRESLKEGWDLWHERRARSLDEREAVLLGIIPE